MVVKIVGGPDGDVRLPYDGRTKPQAASEESRREFNAVVDLSQSAFKVEIEPEKTHPPRFQQQQQRPYGNRTPEEIAIMLEQQRMSGGNDL